VYHLTSAHDMTEANVRSSMEILINNLHHRRGVVIDSFLMDDGKDFLFELKIFMCLRK
jgi:hypothetical protein